jgi:hypothetical protein
VSHPEITENLGFGYESLLVTDPSGVPMFVPLIQVTCLIGRDGELYPLEEQVPPRLAGQWYGDPEFASIEWEPQIAFYKPNTDIVLHGHAYPEAPYGSRGQVGIRVGAVKSLAHVFGDRWLVTSMGEVAMTEAVPFERIPLIYERCFGGWDRRHQDPDAHRCEPRNPVGVGFYDVNLPPEDGLRVPNIEDPNHHYQGYGDLPPPTGFGFVGANWQPRVAFAGTYDDSWDKTRKPFLPDDFDVRFFNAAAPALIVPGHLQGDEEVVVVGATPEGRLAFRLPSIAPPVCMVALRARNRIPVQTVLDTVVVDADRCCVSLLWRGHLALRGGVHDLVSIEIHSDSHSHRVFVAEGVA